MNKEVIFKGISFKGQFPLNSSFKNEPGVYIIADKKNKIADIGETENLKERIADKKKKRGYLWFCPENNFRNRLKIKRLITESFQMA